MTSTQERLVREAIDRQGFVYTTQLAHLAELTVDGATATEALKAIQQAVHPRETLKATKPIKMGIWHIDIQEAFKWLAQYQPRGGDHGEIRDQDSERIQPTGGQGDPGTSPSA